MKNLVGRWRASPTCASCICLLSTVALTVALSPLRVEAAEFSTGGPLTVRWDNTVKYSSMLRVRGQKESLTSNINADDGDRNFDRGFVSNRVDLLSELDLAYEKVGMRVSGAGWYDAAYAGKNDNNSAATVNQVSAGPQGFANGAKGLHKARFDLLDAFAYGKTEIADAPLTVRAGRHTLLWGESLFMASNGVAFGQAPIDIAKALSVPNTQAKELFLPVGQISGQLQLTEALSLESFVQFEWRKNRLPAAGSYFSDIDILDAGGERLLAGPFGVPNFAHGRDQKADNLGQFGAALRYRADALDTDFGFYALNYHDKYPQVYLRPQGLEGFPQIGAYRLVYGEDIQMYGASASTSVGDWNVAGEMSYRRNTPLNSAPQIDLFGNADNRSNALFARGDTLHAQMSGIYMLPKTTLWDGGQFLGEIGAHRLVRFTKNEAAFDTSRDHHALGARMVFEPSYFQVAPGLDLTAPVGVGYNFLGRSPVDPKFNGGAHRGGDISLGVQFTYQNTWKGGVSYTHYFGAEATQTLVDRDFVALSVRRTF